MLLLKSLLLAAGFGLFAAAAAVLLYDAVRWWTRYRAPEAAKLEAPEVHWRWVGKLAALAWAPLLIAFSIVVVPSGMAGVRVSHLGRAARNALSWRPLDRALRRQRRAVRYARSPVHDGCQVA